MQMQQTLDNEDDNNDHEDEDDNEDNDNDDEAVDDDEDHVDASSAATAPDVEYACARARSRRTLVLGYVTAHETNISELSDVCGKLRPRVSSQTFSVLVLGRR